MGGTGVFLNIEAVEPPPGKKRATPRALHKAISRSILDLIWNRCRVGPFRPTAGSYLAEEQSDGYERNLWFANESELFWGFMDHAGCCNGSSNACVHWFGVALDALRERWDKMAAGRGYRITSPRRPPGASLFGTPYPLLAHGSQALCIPRFEPGTLDWHPDWGGPFWDDGSPRPRIADFEDYERDRVFGAAIAGACWCGLCFSLRDSSLRSRSPADVLGAAWLHLGSDPALRPKMEAICDAVRQYEDWEEEPAGPPLLQDLHARLPEPRPEPWELAGICFRLLEG